MSSGSLADLGELGLLAELERRGLVPVQVERAPRPVAPRPQRVSAFAEGWS